MVISHNMMSMNANRQLNINNKSKTKSSERLASGFRINRAADDAAGLTISEKMRAQIRGLNKGEDNIQDGISMIKVADGALAEVQSMLHRMTELAVQAANDTNTASDRQAIQEEINQLTEEITRIGKTTTFNTMKIFDDAFNKEDATITSLITCASADKGYLSEAVQVNGRWYPAATLDFSNVAANNISLLNGKGFSFYCSQVCDEVFDFKFATDGTPSSATNLSGKVTHEYVIDISNCTNGSDIVNAIYDYVAANLPTDNGTSTSNMLPGSLNVSHSNYMIKTDAGDGLMIYANGSIQKYSTGTSTWTSNGSATEAEAKNSFPRPEEKYAKYGSIDCSSLMNIAPDTPNVFNIQCSSDSDNHLDVTINRMNATLLGVNNLNVKTHKNASKSITSIQNALEKVSSQRSSLGAFQNRLEHTYNSNKNIEENTQAAESRIRDTDMAKEMVNYSTHNILEQAGISVLTQANNTPEGVLTLIN